MSTKHGAVSSSSSRSSSSWKRLRAPCSCSPSAINVLASSRRFPERLPLANVADAFVPGGREPIDADLEYITAANLDMLPEGVHCLEERFAFDHAFLAHCGVA